MNITPEQQQAFIASVLDDYADELESRLLDSLDRKNVGDTGALRASIHTAVIADAPDGVMRVQLSMNDSGRLAERGYFAARRANKQAWTGGGKKPKLTAKDTRFYAQTVFSTIPPLIDELMYGYGAW